MTAVTPRPCLTVSGRRLLTDRARHLREGELAQLRPLLAEPQRDERLLAEFERLTADLLTLEALLAEADILRQPPADGAVGLGCLVEVELPEGRLERVRPVHPGEAFLDDERISCESPLGRALLGSRAGDWIVVRAPRGAYTALVARVLDDSAEDLVGAH